MGAVSTVERITAVISSAVALISLVGWIRSVAKASKYKSRGGLPYLKLLLLHRTGRVRFSSTSMLSLEVNGHFMTILGKYGVQDCWSPIGGVLKHHPSAEPTLRGLHCQLDASNHEDHDRERDLRLIMPIRKFREFLDWYDTGQGRETVETSLLREMYEELSEIGLPVEEWFRGLRLPLARDYSAPPTIFKGDEGIWHYRLFVTVSLEEPARSELLRTVKDKHHPQIAFVHPSEIEALQHGGLLVGSHSRALLHEPVESSEAKKHHEASKVPERMSHG